MAVIRMKILDKSEEDIVHEQSLKSLNEIGVLVRSESVLKLLDESGANVDYKKFIAKISEEMVNEALIKAPKEFKLCARDPKNDIDLPVDSIPKISTDGLTVYTIDPDTGEKRSAVRKDLARLANLADALDPVDFFWPMVTVNDVPEATHSTHEFWTSMKGCAMHVQGDTLSALEAKTQIEMASLVVGGREKLKKRPIFSSMMCPIAPLSFEKGAVEAQVELARADIPVVSMSMSLSGMSAPVTFAGTIVNANTENLASLVITQSAQPGAPHIYSSESSPINMLTGSMNWTVSEFPAICAAGGQMAKRYGRPAMVGGWGVGGSKPGINMSFCEVTASIMGTLCNTDLVPGIGGFDDAKGCALEQIVIDAYFWDEYRQFIRKFSVTEEDVALDVVREVGHGNSFLTHPHTAKNFKKALHFWDKKKLAWQATLSDSMVGEAREIAKAILKEHEVKQIDPDIVKQCDAVLYNFDKAMAK